MDATNASTGSGFSSLTSRQPAICPANLFSECFEVQGTKKGNNCLLPFFDVVTPTGQFSNHLLERFRKIYELKAVIPVQMLQPAILPKRLKVA